MTGAARSVLFVGPTLPEAHEWGSKELSVRPPARQGDVIDAVYDGASLIGLIDGVFEIGPSVWHKEILFAMEHGVRVAGAASLGALRAAELHPFGMVGIGSIYERYRRSEIIRDDAVMISHAPAEFGWQAWTVSLFDMLDTIEAARPQIDSEVYTRLIELAGQLHFKERSWEALVAGCSKDSGQANLMQILMDCRQHTKRDDALKLVAALPALQALPLPMNPVSAPRSVYFRRLLEARLAGRPGKGPDAASGAALPGGMACEGAATPECHDRQEASAPAK